MPVLKNLRHEFFVREYIKTGCSNATEAYRRAWLAYRPPNCGPLEPESYRRTAWKLRTRPEIRQRLKEIQVAIIKRSDITMDRQLNKLEEALEIAKRNVKTADMISAINSQSKMVGLLRERVEQGAVGEFDGIEDATVILEKVAADPTAGPAEAERLAQALGIDWSADGGGAGGEEGEAEAESDIMDEPPPTNSVN